MSHKPPMLSNTHVPGTRDKVRDSIDLVAVNEADGHVT